MLFHACGARLPREQQRLWDAGLKAAAANRKAGKKNTAYGEGGVQYSTFSQKDIDTLRSIRADHPGLDRVSIFDFTGKDIRKAEKWARKFNSEMGTKSLFFRRWFGDWRANDISGVRCIDMKNSTVNQKNRAVQNKDMSKGRGKKGIPINLGKDFFEDSLHYAKQGKDEKAITKLLANIDEVIENAALFDTQLSDLSSKNKKGSTQFMHILYAPVSYNGAPFLAKITVEEYREDGILRAYNAQRITMSALPRSYFQQLNQAASAGDSRLHADEIMVSQLYDLVKQYDKDFKARPEANPVLLNPDGTPKVFYHGTGAKFTSFDPSRIGQNYDESAGGFFFTDRGQSAENYAALRDRRNGGHIMACYLSINRPYVLNSPSALTPAEYYDMHADDIVREADIGGYNGVIIFSTDETMVIAFDPTQIKSATDNISTFDPDNPDIRYSVSDSVTDRALLLEAAERADASQELKRFREKARELERLWDAGLKAAAANRKAGKKNTAYGEGGVQHAKEDSESLRKIAPGMKDADRTVILRRKDVSAPSGYIEGKFFIPVRFSVKQSVMSGNKLYVIYGSDQIKMPEVAKTLAAGNPQANAFYSGNISISDIVSEVKDEDILVNTT